MIATPPVWTAKDAAIRDAAERLLGITSPKDRLALDALLAHRWFIVKNDGGTKRERIKCFRHQDSMFPVYHETITWCCLPRPFRGLSAALYAIDAAWSPGRKPSALNKGRRNLATDHPNTYGRRLAGVRGEEVYSSLVGTIEPISSGKALILEADIRRFDADFWADRN